MATNQAAIVNRYIEAHGSITSLEAMKLGILRLSAVVYEMKRAGIPIVCTRTVVTNADGSTSCIGVYSFAKENKKE